MQPDHSGPLPTRYYAVIFLIALVVIAAQLLIGRILSVTLYHHFAFVGITLAMLGLTAGALRVYLSPDRFSAARADEVLAGYSARFAVTLTCGTLLYMIGPSLLADWKWDDFVRHGPYYLACLGISFLLLLSAFIAGGVCIALLLTRFPRHAGRLYACDFAGAGLSCLLVIAALRVLDPIGILLLLAAVMAIMAWRLLPGHAAPFMRRRIRLGAIVLVPLCLFQVAGYLHGTPPLRLMWAKSNNYRVAPDVERWNTYSHISVQDIGTGAPFGWAFGALLNPHPPIAQKLLLIDANAATPITNFHGDGQSVAFLKDDMINLAYNLRPVHDVAVIGVGGGRDILSGIAFQAAHILGIELNPAVLETLTRTYGDFSGHLDRRPDVTLVNAEARSYLDSHPQKHDLIQISLIDTWATTAAGGLTLSENKLYTAEAWEDFLNRLTDDGMLSVSRWYNPVVHSGEYYRLLALANHAVRALHPHDDPGRYVLAASVGNTIVTVIVSKSPLTREEINRFGQTCMLHHFRPLALPGYATPLLAGQIIAATDARPAPEDSYYDYSAPTDDRPFFFNIYRLSGIFAQHPGERMHTMNFMNNEAIVSLFYLSLFVLAASLAYIAWPMWRIRRQHRAPLSEVLPHMLYFLGIGLGFMMIELSQMQRLMIFLGHPVYSLSVVLFTLLMAGSAGSYAQSALLRRNGSLWRMPALLCIVLAATGLATPLAAEYLKYYDTGARILASAALLAPAGFFMGTMFPTGVALVSRHESLLPWYWGVNGIASVFASVIGVVTSLEFGFAASFWMGVACYIACFSITYAFKARVP